MAKKATKGARGSGTIRQRSNGTWEGRYTVGHDPKTGKQIQRSVYGKTQKEVAQKLRQITAEIDDGTYTGPCRLTLGEWLDIWLSEYTGNVKVLTYECYKSHIVNHIKPEIGSVKLSALNTVTIQKFYNGLTKGDHPLSAKTVKNIHGVLHRALSHAVRLGYIRVNPSDDVILPKVSKPEINPLTDNSLSAFLKAIKDHPMETLFLTDIFTGMRKGEILGLTWDCVDFERGVIVIEKQLIQLRDGTGEYRITTTKSGKTRIVKPARYVMDVLRAQLEKQNKMKEQAAEAWDNEQGFVFTDAFGHHLAHTTVYHTFKRIVRSIGIPEIRFHDLRHSFAVASLQSGDDIKTVQENLGHYTAAFTLDVYGHISEKMRDDSSRRMDAFIQNILENSNT